MYFARRDYRLRSLVGTHIATDVYCVSFSFLLLFVYYHCWQGAAKLCIVALYFTYCNNVLKQHYVLDDSLRGRPGSLVDTRLDSAINTRVRDL